MTEAEKTNLWKTMVDWSQIYFNDDAEIIWLVITTVVFYILVFVLNVPMTKNEKPFMVELLESKLWILIVMFIFILFFKYVLKINIVDIFFGIFNQGVDSVVDAVSSTMPASAFKPQTTTTTTAATTTVTDAPTTGVSNEEVFNIANNLYTYNDAAAVCKSYGARLANYNDMEESYNNGGEWCSYGWSDNQMAYFPTQKNTWEKLQKNPKTKNNCGRPGINGGYMANPNLRFGVNCYGVKPAPKQTDLDMMKAENIQIIPKTSEEIEMEKKVQFWKENADKMMRINSYNGERWSKY
jgi:hypothetical protein